MWWRRSFSRGREGRKINAFKHLAFGLTLRLAGPASLKIFYLIQSQKGDRGGWSSSQILGTHLLVDF